MDKFLGDWKKTEFNNLCKAQCDLKICGKQKYSSSANFSQNNKVQNNKPFSERIKRQTAIITDSVINDSIFINGRFSLKFLNIFFFWFFL